VKRLAFVVLALAGAWPMAATAQVAARNQQLSQAQAAYDGFDTPRALTLLRAALDPARGPPDSAWGRGVQLLAQILTEDQRPSEADVWLGWAFRLNPAIEIDTVTFLPAVVAASRRALAGAGSGVSRDSAVRSTWEWAAAGFSDTEGGFRVSGAGAPVQVLVEGVGVATVGQVLRLPPGTYNLQASASGFVSVRVTREVLPRTVTALQFTLVSTAAAALAAADTVLPATALDAVARRVVLLQPERYDIPAATAACATGFAVGRAGLVATSYRAIRGADRVTVNAGPGRTFTAEVRVAAHDAANDLALLTVPIAFSDTVGLGGSVGTGALWAVGFGDCRTATSRRSTVSVAAARPDALGLGTRLPEGFRGAVLADRNGNVLGFVVAPDSGAALTELAAALNTARQAVAAGGALQTPGDVSRRENHSYGTLTLRSAAAGAEIRVRGLEAWHWADLAREGPAPLTFTGPMGRYEVSLAVGGTVRRTANATIVPGARGQFTIDPQVAQGVPERTQPGAAPGIQPARGKSKLPFILIGAGVVGGGAAALLLGGGGGGGGGGGNGTTGAITVQVPVNP